MNTKICSKCKIEKTIDNFSLRKDRNDFRKMCKSCVKEQRKIYKINNKEKVKRNKHLSYLRNKNTYKKYSIKNKEKIKEKQRLYKLNNPENVKEIKRKSYIKNREKRLEKSRKYNKENKEKLNKIAVENNKKRYRSDPNFKLRYTLRKRFYKLVKGIHKKNSALDLLGCTVEEFKIYIEKQFKEGMTWDNHGKWHIDHIKPCASFDLTDPEQQKICFHYTNLQPLWAKDNLSKGAKILPEYIKE